MCIKSEFKEICLKLATNGRSGKGFLLTSKVYPRGVFCPCPGAVYMYKVIKNLYKIRFQKDHFETCNIWAKKKGLSVVIKILSPMDCLPLPGWPLVRGKSGKFDFSSQSGKVREFCKLVREILNTKKVREKSGNSIILAQNMCCSRYFDYLKCEKC